MGETTQERTRRTSDLVALAMYSLAVFLIMLGHTFRREATARCRGHLVSRELRPCGLGL
jgi:hypothetical protein